MKKIISSIMVIFMIMFNLTLVMCSSNDDISKKDIKEITDEVIGVSKEEDKYNLCMLIDMEAKSTTLESDAGEEGYDTAEGNDVPVEVVLTKKEGNFYIESVKEYESLEIAQSKNKNFIKE